MFERFRFSDFPGGVLHLLQCVQGLSRLRFVDAYRQAAVWTRDFLVVEQPGNADRDEHPAGRAVYAAGVPFRLRFRWCCEVLFHDIRSGYGSFPGPCGDGLLSKYKDMEKNSLPAMVLSVFLGSWRPPSLLFSV